MTICTIFSIESIIREWGAIQFFLSHAPTLILVDCSGGSKGGSGGAQAPPQIWPAPPDIVSAPAAPNPDIVSAPPDIISAPPLIWVWIRLWLTVVINKQIGSVK